jgi:endonuclease/exonuclease/phosphatase (EEP) superfamily protein YafD
MPPSVNRRRLSYLVVSGALLGAILSVTCSSAPPRTARAPGPNQPTLTVMTYNVNYGLAGDESTLAAIENERADLVLLQETTPDWELVLRERFGARYEHMAFRHCCGAGGMAVLSRFPFPEGESLAPPQGGWFPAWTFELDTPIGPVQVLNVHLRPQIGDSGPNVVGIASGMVSTPPIRKREITDYLPRLRPNVPALIAGDFNESEDGSALEYLEERGFRSTLPEFSDEDTWSWNMSVIGTVRRRFDHIVYGQGLEPLSARVVQAGNSDHLPVVAVFGRD